jgi:hypothetical protein
LLSPYASTACKSHKTLVFGHFRNSSLYQEK